MIKTIAIDAKPYESERLYPIGYKFTLKQGKRSPKECEVIDYRVTYNGAGEVTAFRYLVQYFSRLNHAMTCEEMVQTSIDRSTNNGWKALNRKD